MRHYDVALLKLKTKQGKEIDLIYKSLEKAVRISIQLRYRPNIEYAEAYPKKINKMSDSINIEQYAEELEYEYSGVV